MTEDEQSPVRPLVVHQLTPPPKANLHPCQMGIDPSFGDTVRVLHDRISCDMIGFYIVQYMLQHNRFVYSYTLHEDEGKARLVTKRSVFYSVSSV